MRPLKIWSKTLIFSWIRLGIGLLTFFIAALLLGSAWLIIQNLALTLTWNIIIGAAAFIISLIVYFLFMGRFGYSIQMGHLAIIERAHRGQEIPSNPVEFSKDVIKQRFGSTSRYFSLHRETTKSVKQITRVIRRGFSLDSDEPNLKGGQWLLHLFCTPALGRLDECCLAYTLRKNDHEVNAATVDALTLMTQNWKPLLRKALFLSLLIFFLCIAVFSIFYLPGFYFAKSMAFDSMPWLIASFFLMLTVKIAFLDSYALTKIVCIFLEMTAQFTIDSKNYKKLDSWSKTYAKIRRSADDASEKADEKEIKSLITESEAKNEPETEPEPEAETEPETEPEPEAKPEATPEPKPKQEDDVHL